MLGTSACLGLLAMAAAPLELSWQAPPGCPRVEEVESRVRELVGGSFDGPVRLRARAVVNEVYPPWTVELELATRAGVSTRRLDAETCQALGSAVAVILALAVDRAPEARIPLRPRPERPGTSEMAGPAWTFGAALEGGWGHLPELAIGSAVRVALQWSSLRLGLGFGAWLPSTARAGEVRAESGLFAGELRLARDFRPGGGPLEIAPELVFELGRFAARGFGPAFSRTETRAALHLSTGAGLSAALNLFGPLWLRVRVDLHVPLARPAVTVDGFGELFRVGPVSPRVGVGLELRVHP